MATYLENLTTTRDNIAATLATITAAPKPSYTIGDQTVSWAEYFEILTNQLEALEKRISVADGPQEYTSTAFTT